MTAKGKENTKKMQKCLCLHIFKGIPQSGRALMPFVAAERRERGDEDQKRLMRWLSSLSASSFGSLSWLFIWSLSMLSECFDPLV